MAVGFHTDDCLERSAARELTVPPLPHKFHAMTATAMLELKQRVSRLTKAERRELNAYMIRLRHETPEWRKTLSRRMRAMDAGRKVSSVELRRHLARD